MNPSFRKDLEACEAREPTRALSPTALADVTGGAPSVWYQLGYVLGGLDAMVVDAYEAVAGNIPGL